MDASASHLQRLALQDIEVEANPLPGSVTSQVLGACGDPCPQVPFSQEQGDDEHDDPLAEDADELTCAICLGQIPPAETAVVKGCEHMYCVCCILHWASFKEAASCPQCKYPFQFLQVYRQLDGTITDYPMEESLTLLKRAKWFEEHCKAQEKGKAVVMPRMDARGNEQDWFGDYYEDFEAEDDEIEDYYFSSAAGPARAVLGNRRLGENGYMRSGRMYARPVTVTTPPAHAKGKGKTKAVTSNPLPGSAGPSSSSPAKPSGSKSSSSGRRARRAAKRAAGDDEDD